MAIAWRESDVRALLNRLQADEISPYKLQQIWQIFGSWNPTFGSLAFFSRNPVFASHRCFGFPAVFSAPAGKVFSVPRVFAVPSGAALQFPLKVLR